MLNFLFGMPIVTYTGEEVDSKLNMALTISRGIECVFCSIFIIGLILIIVKHKKLYGEKMELLKFHKNISGFLCIIYIVYIVMDMIWSACACISFEPVSSPPFLVTIIAYVIFFMPILVWICGIIFFKKQIKSAPNIMLILNMLTIFYLIVQVWGSFVHVYHNHG